MTAPWVDLRHPFQMLGSSPDFQLSSSDALCLFIKILTNLIQEDSVVSLLGTRVLRRGIGATILLHRSFFSVDVVFNEAKCYYMPEVSFETTVTEQEKTVLEFLRSGICPLAWSYKYSGK